MKKHVYERVKHAFISLGQGRKYSLGILKNFVKAMDREASGFAFLQKFPWISMEKLKAGIFDGLQTYEGSNV